MTLSKMKTEVMVSVVALRNIVIFICALLISSVSIAETIEVRVGPEQIDVVSSSYQKASSGALGFSAIYARQLLGSWSGFAEYRNTIDSALSAGLLGISHDSVELRMKGGFIAGDGTPEIAKIPIWWTRFSIGLGLFRLVDVLRSNDRSLGTRNLVPVKASLFGVKLGASVQRFLTDNWAASGGVSYVAATAGNFGVSSLGLYLGVMYNMD